MRRGTQPIRLPLEVQPSMSHPQHQQSTNQSCHRCGSSGHLPNQCHVFVQKLRCRFCNTMGHLEKVVFVEVLQIAITLSLPHRAHLIFVEAIFRHLILISNFKILRENLIRVQTSRLLQRVPPHLNIRISQNKLSLLGPFSPSTHLTRLYHLSPTQLS